MIANWWAPPPTRKAYVLLSPQGGEIGIDIPANFVLCDICNKTIAIRPVPLLYENYAACPACFERDTAISVEEAAKADGVTLATLSIEEIEQADSAVETA